MELEGSSYRTGPPCVGLAREPTTLHTTAQHGTIVIAMQQTAADVNVIDGQAQSTDTPPWKVSSFVGLPPTGNNCCVRAHLGAVQKSPSECTMSTALSSTDVAEAEVDECCRWLLSSRS